MVEMVGWFNSWIFYKNEGEFACRLRSSYFCMKLRRTLSLNYNASLFVYYKRLIYRPMYHSISHHTEKETKCNISWKVETFRTLCITLCSLFLIVFLQVLYLKRERERSCDNKSSVYDILPCDFELFVKLDWVFDIFNFDNTLMWIHHIESPWARIVDWQHLK